MDLKSKKFKIVTEYNRIDLRRQQDRIELRSHDDAFQSIIDLQQPHRLALKNLESLIAVLLFTPSPQRVLLLGTAGGSLIHFLRHYFDVDITSVDIDAELVEKMLQMEILPPPQAGLRYVYDDASHYLDNCHQHFDLILVDIFDGAQTPKWVMDRNTGENLRRLVPDGGAVAYNLLIASETEFKGFYRDLRQTFDQKTLCLPVEGYENTICYALRNPPPALDMHGYQQRAIELGGKLELDLMKVLAVIYNTNPVDSGLI